MNKYSLTAVSITGGLLSGLAWANEWGLILLVSFVPFLLIWEHLFQNAENYTPNAFFIYLLPGFVILNILVIGWVRVASMAGAIAIIMGLSFLMSFSFWLAHVIRLKAGSFAGYVSAVAFWLASEFLSLNVNLVSPWLNLGNGLAGNIAFIQWYEMTGTSGGSLWILLSNILLAVFLTSILKNKKKTIFFALWIMILVVPSAYSIYRYKYLTESTSASEEIVIVQPQIDPYTEKFAIPFEAQLDKAIALASSSAEKSVSWIIMPETTVDDPVNLNDLNSDRYINKIRGLTDSFPETSVVAGLVSYKLYPPSEKAPTISARKIDSTGFFYDHFNTAFKIDSGKEIEVYHKSKLVPGIEMQFANGPGKLIAEILPQLGGTKWGYGFQDIRATFINNLTGSRIAPIICYESVFGEYITGYVRNGANALFIITNDGWWKNTNGYDQHLSYASLRAIETRRPVARSANTGVSCIIDIRGKRIKETEWWTQDVLKGEIVPETRITPYVKYGDYLLRTGTVISAVIMLIIFVAVPLRKKVVLIGREKPDEE